MDRELRLPNLNARVVAPSAGKQEVLDVAQGTIIRSQVSRQARDAAREAEPWLVRLGRLGFAAKGLVYLLIGTLAGEAALGWGGSTTDGQGVLVQVAQARFGQLVLAVVGLGLGGYALWRFVQAVLDTENHGAEMKGLWVRGSYVWSGIIHTMLAITAFGLLRGKGTDGSGESAVQKWMGWLMEQPFGPWLVAAVGIGMLATAATQLKRAMSASFTEDLHLGQMRPETHRWAERTGRMGYAARGVTFGIMGIFFLLAAYWQAPGEARGVAGALNALAEQPYGPYLLALVALGLAAYGVYMFVEARYRRMVIR